MSLVIGRRGWVNIALETNPGDPVQPSTHYIPFLECDLMEKLEILPELAARGIRDEQGESSTPGKKHGEGALKVNLDPDLAPVLLGMVMGDFGTPTNEGDGVYTHTFARKANNTPKAASIIFNRAGIDQNLFHSAVINSAELAFSDGMAELTANFLSRFPVASTSGTLSTVSGTLFTFKDARVRMAADLATAVSATSLKVKELSLVINNNAEMIHVVGNNDVNAIAVKNFGISGNISLNFEDTTERDIFRNLTKRAMIIEFEGNQIGGGLSQFVKFRIAKMRFDNYSPELPIDDIASQGIDFVGEYSSGDAKTIDIQVRNRKSSY